MIKVIGISGKAGTGKSYLTKNYLIPAGYFEVSLSWHFKVWLVSTKQATYDDVFHTKPPHIRHLLQQEGTARGRDVYGTDIWVDTLSTWIKVWNESWGVTKFIIPDIRFKNELYGLRSRGYDIYRIVAPGRVAQSSLTVDQLNHPSEIDLDDVSVDDFSGVINNDVGVDPSVLQQRMQDILIDSQLGI